MTTSFVYYGVLAVIIARWIASFQKSPIPFSPVGVHLPPLAPLLHNTNRNLSPFASLRVISDWKGAEALVQNPKDGWIYSGLSDGRIVRIPSTLVENEAEVIGRLGPETEGFCSAGEASCGRPLGIALHPLHPEERLLVCDSSNSTRGLVDFNIRTGEWHTVLSEFEGVPLHFCNSIATRPSFSRIFVSHSSAQRGRNLFFEEFLEADATGRILSIDLTEGVASTEVLVNNVPFSNGIAISPDGQQLLYAETTRSRVMGLHLSADGHALGDPYVFADLPVMPDNIALIQQDEMKTPVVYVAGCVQRSAIVDFLLSQPLLRSVVVNFIPMDIIKKIFFGFVYKIGDDRVIELDMKDGSVVRAFYDPSGTAAHVSEGRPLLGGEKMLLGSFDGEQSLVVADIPPHH